MIRTITIELGFADGDDETYVADNLRAIILENPAIATNNISVSVLYDSANATFSPTRDNIIVLPDPVITETASGLTIPEDAIKRPRSGIVVAIGPGRKDYPMTGQIGQRAYFYDDRGIEIEKDEQTMLVLMESQDVLMYEAAAK
jgi:chaperonin GroES